MSDELIKKAWFVVQLFRECDAIQLPHKPTEEVLTGMIDRIEELEAKLAKAVEFAEIVEKCGNGPLWDLARATLAELTGGKDDTDR